MSIALNRREAVIPTTPREARDAIGMVEMRTSPVGEFRATRSENGIEVGGYATVFDSPSLDMGGWYEVISRSAFDTVLRGNPDVRFLVNHDGLPLARTTNGSLSLAADKQGLGFTAGLADTTISRDLTVLMERGDISQMSFAFRVAPDGVEWDVDDEGRERRTILQFSEFDEISAVTFPAYPATTVGTRSLPDETEDGREAEDSKTPSGAGDEEQIETSRRSFDHRVIAFRG